MSLILAIETSSSEYALALGRDGQAIFSSKDATPAYPRDLSRVLSDALRDLKISAAEIDGIAVNVGPGGLGAIRAGVAFANALSFALCKPVLSRNFFELAGMQARRSSSSPVLIAVPGPGGSAFLGLFENGQVQQTKFGSLEKLAGELAGNRTELAVAGRLRGAVARILSNRTISDTQIDSPSPATLLENAAASFDQTELWTSQAIPLNEEAGLFHGQA